MSAIVGKPRPLTGRPKPGEDADYVSADIAAVPGDDAIEALAQLAEQAPAFFRWPTVIDRAHIDACHAAGSAFEGTWK